MRSRLHSRTRRQALVRVLGPALLGPLAVGPLLLTQPTQVAWAAAPPPELAQALPQARLQGSGTMRFFGLHIYDITLWSAQPVRADDPTQALALVLRYARRLVGRQIAERSLDEMRRVGEFSPAQGQQWLQRMLQLFPDVAAQDRFTGVHLPGQTARFFYNGALRGDVADAEFARLFFDIWLSPRTSEPQLRARLLGGS